MQKRGREDARRARVAFAAWAEENLGLSAVGAAEAAAFHKTAGRLVVVGATYDLTCTRATAVPPARIEGDLVVRANLAAAARAAKRRGLVRGDVVVWH